MSDNDTPNNWKMRDVDEDDEVDEIEVVLAYQVELDKALKLGSPLRGMRFFDVSDVSYTDLGHALSDVRTRENSEFPAWLSSWTPWERLIERHDKARYDLAQEALYEALEQRPGRRDRD
ncbi:MAG: NEL-type E3 ubiquitin ligase domain-containing protein [Pararobbsia sp.]